jgi:hypothetical protein
MYKYANVGHCSATSDNFYLRRVPRDLDLVRRDLDLTRRERRASNFPPAYLGGLSLTPEQLKGFQRNLPYSKSAETFLGPYAQSSITRSGTPYGLADPR